MQYTKTSGRQSVHSPEMILLGSFVLWRLYYILLRILSISPLLGGEFGAMYVLCLIGLLLLFIRPTLKCDFSLLPWACFIGMILVTLLLRKAYLMYTLMDLVVYITGMIFLMCMEKSPEQKNLVIHLLLLCGGFITATICLDEVFGLFRVHLLSIYNYGAREYKLSLGANGGIIPSTTAAGGFVLSGLAAYIGMIRIRKKKFYLPEYMIIGLFCAAIVLTKKRSSLIFGIGALAGIRFFRYLWKKEKSKLSLSFILRVLLAAASAIGAFFVLYNSFPAVQTVVDSYLSRFDTEDTTLSGRTQLYEVAVRLFLAHPVTGIGWGRYRFTIAGVYSRFLQSEGDAHNVYLQLLSETGLVGIFLFLLAVVFPLAESLKRYHTELMEHPTDCRKHYIELGLFYQFFFLLYCFSGNPLYDPDFVLVYFYGLFLAL